MNIIARYLNNRKVGWKHPIRKTLFCDRGKHSHIKNSDCKICGY